MRLWRPGPGSMASMLREIGRNNAAVRWLDLPLRLTPSPRTLHGVEVQGSWYRVRVALDRRGVPNRRPRTSSLPSSTNSSNRSAVIVSTLLIKLSRCTICMRGTPRGPDEYSPDQLVVGEQEGV